MFFWGKSLIPIHYISNSADRFSFYTKINKAKKEEDFEDVKKELKDRYGQIPKETKSFINLAEISLLYRDSLVNNININEDSLVFKLPDEFQSAGDGLISRILSYESTSVIKIRFKKDIDSVFVVFLTKKGFDWYGELINCISLFYKG